ncbi:LOW QUALITY PROTEIN: hypothetical protein PHMEG_00039165 [Phytophthora megakarya]|uniref:Uncharacterized protein n=1 Tax=Phytophthora megakarya TaxID=4795 RepID=A0A225UG20_9STRA|nr:LOW QUALITY PROTEIN: hypothetical protein PHMEG_00039165 [Phytophthora megakarya]
MSFMVPVGVPIDTADGTACLPDEVRIQMHYAPGDDPVTDPCCWGPDVQRAVTARAERAALVANGKTTWVTSEIKAPVGRHTYLRVTNITERLAVLDAHVTVSGCPSTRYPARSGSCDVDRGSTVRRAYGATLDVNAKT